jgi:hypothetical protein
MAGVSRLCSNLTPVGAVAVAAAAAVVAAVATMQQSDTGSAKTRVQKDKTVLESGRNELSRGIVPNAFNKEQETYVS